MRHHADADLTPKLLTSIHLRGFRNLVDARWEPGSGAHLLLGSNGAGKTSLLEALYLLATTRSFRTARIDECCRHGSDEFSLAGMVESASRSDLELGWGPKGRWRRLNGTAVTGAQYLEALPVVSWSSADVRVIDGAPRDRRRFLDQGIVSRRPATVEILSRYRRTLEQKRELLRGTAVRRGHDVSAWNELLAEAASELIERRSEFIVELDRYVQSIIGESGLELPQVRMKYRPSPALTKMTKDGIRRAFEGLCSREIEERRVLSGPHRDEVEITWDGVEISKIASAGEKKLLGILMCAARGKMLAELGRRPIVLLDDIDAELDRDRLEAAWHLFDLSPQVIASSCHTAVCETLGGARIWHLQEGSVAAS